MEPPQHFCWTKYGTEAGEPVDSILRRKEQERMENDGIFLWGIGNSIGPSVLALLESESHPEILFTPMRSRPAAKDASPTMTGRWESATTLDGLPWELPAHTVVTSGIGPNQPVPLRHYALVCRRPDPLDADAAWWLDDAELTNLRTGSRVGGSQVTAVVRRTPSSNRRDRYTVTMRAALTSPYMVTLSEWSPIGTPSDRPYAINLGWRGRSRVTV